MSTVPIYIPPPSSGSGVSDHGALTGLSDDDHSQYHNDARGDLRYQALDSDLTAIAALTTTAFGRGLLDDADAAAARASLGVLASAVLFDSTLGSDTATIDTGAGGIAAGYNVLEAWVIIRTSQAIVGSSVLIRVNNDTGGNYDVASITLSDATLAGSNSLAQTSWALSAMGDNADANGCSVLRITIPSYVQTTFYKVGEATYSAPEDTAGDNKAQMRGLRYRSTTAISRMSVTGGASSDLKAGSRLLIYGR